MAPNCVRVLDEAQQLERLHGLTLALELYRPQRLELACVAHQSLRGWTDDDCSRLGELLEPGRNVHGVAHGRGLHILGGGEHLACVNSDADREVDTALLQLRIQTGETLTQLQRSAHGPERVILATKRDAEDGHDGVADETIDRAAVTLDGFACCGVISVHDPAKRLWVELLPECRRSDHVTEQHGHSLSLLHEPTLGWGANAGKRAHPLIYGP